MNRTHRIQLRNCIREDTFRYYVDENIIDLAWKKIQDIFGAARQWGDFRIFVIENDGFIIRKSEDENAFTLIKKKAFQDADEKIIHNIIGFGS